MKPVLVKMQQNWTLAKGDQEQFKAGVSFLEYVDCDRDVVYFLLGISPASNYSWPTFQNPVSVPSSKAGCTV